MWGQGQRAAGLRGPQRFSRLSLALALAAPLAGAALLVAAPFNPAHAADARMVAIGENRVGAVRVAVGKSETLRTSRGFVDLVVGDPEIADVMPLTDATLYVLGKKIGTTNVSIYDASKQLVGVIEIEVAYNTPRLASDLAVKGGAARVDTANGRTVLTGEMPDAVAAAKAVALARQYGGDVLNHMKVKGPQQVMLEVRFVEASRNAGKDLGINWQAAGKHFSAYAGTASLASGYTPFGALIGRVLSGGGAGDVVVHARGVPGHARRHAAPNQNAQ